MAFAITHPGVTSAILGPRTMEQLEDALAGAEVTLGDNVLDQIDTIVAPGTDVGQLDMAYTPDAIRTPALRRRPPRCPQRGITDNQRAWLHRPAGQAPWQYCRFPPSATMPSCNRGVPMLMRSSSVVALATCGSRPFTPWRWTAGPSRLPTDGQLTNATPLLGRVVRCLLHVCSDVPKRPGSNRPGPTAISRIAACQPAFPDMLITSGHAPAPAMDPEQRTLNPQADVWRSTDPGFDGPSAPPGRAALRGLRCRRAGRRARLSGKRSGSPARRNGWCSRR